MRRGREYPALPLRQGEYPKGGREWITCALYLGEQRIIEKMVKKYVNTQLYFAQD